MNNNSSTKVLGIDPQEMQEWIESFDAIFRQEGRDSASLLLDKLRARAESLGVGHAFTANTPYINTIPAEKQPVFPGDQEIERRIKSLIRWNALAMVVRADRVDTASAAIFPHTLRSRRCSKSGSTISFGRSVRVQGDMVYFQGHASAGRLRPRLSRRPYGRRASRKLPPRVEAGWRIIFLSASLAHARFLAVSPPCRWALSPLDGHLPGPLHRYLENRSLIQPTPQQSVGVHRRWRDR